MDFPEGASNFDRTMTRSQELQKALDLAHEVRETLPMVCVFVNLNEWETFVLASVYITNGKQSTKHWWKNTDAVSVSGQSDLRRIVRLKNIFVY